MRFLPSILRVRSQAVVSCTRLLGARHCSFIGVSMDGKGFTIMNHRLARTNLANNPLYDHLLEALCALLPRHRPETRHKAARYASGQERRAGEGVFLPRAVGNL